MFLTRYGKRDYDRFYGAGLWSHDTFPQLLRDAATRAPERVAIADDARRLTYAELLAEVRALAWGLRGLGVGQGDVLSVQLPNSVELVVALWACAELGAVYNPLNPGYRQAEVDNIVGATRSKAVLCASSYKGFSYPSLFNGERVPIRVVVGGDAPPGWITYQGVVTSGASGGPALGPDPDWDPDAVFLLGATSGTTGSPKIYMHTANTQAQEARRINTLLGMGADDTFLAVAPLTHRGALMFGACTALAAGARLVAVRAFDADAVLDVMARERVTAFMTIPTIIFDLLNVYTARPRDLSPLRRVLLSGAPVTQALVERLRRTWPQCVPVTGYGLSETGYSTLTLPDDPADKLLTSGRAVPGMEVRVVREDGGMAGAREVGEVQLRGAQVCAGYFDNQEATRAAFTPDGWFRSGDLAFFDEQGYLHPVGRQKHVIIRAGLKIHAEEVELLLTQHPRIAAACVVPLAHARLGEQACACVVTRDGQPLGIDVIQRHMQDLGVARHTWPEHVLHFDSFPLNPVGKIDRREIARQARARVG